MNITHTHTNTHTHTHTHTDTHTHTHVFAHSRYSKVVGPDSASQERATPQCPSVLWAQRSRDTSDVPPHVFAKDTSPNGRFDRGDGPAAAAGADGDSGHTGARAETVDIDSPLTWGAWLEGLAVVAVIVAGYRVFRNRVPRRWKPSRFASPI